MSFRELDIRKEYRSKKTNIVKEFYEPILKYAKTYDRAVGFFTSSSLSELAFGLIPFIKNGGKIRIVASPKLTEEDISAINSGYKKRDEVIHEVLIRELKESIDNSETERLSLLANLIADNILNVKIAYVSDYKGVGIYHEKLGIFHDFYDNVVAFSGSMNESKTAISINYETIDVFTSWEDEERESYKVKAFERIWNNDEEGLVVSSYNDINELFIQKYKKDINSYDDINIVLKEDSEEVEERRHVYRNIFRLPESIKLFDYQEDAISNWEKQRYKGIFDMATGTGKTFTALGSIERLAKKLDYNLGVFIVCPFIHLVTQWYEDVSLCKIEPIVAHSQSDCKNWKKKLVHKNIYLRKFGDMFICITTNATFKSDIIQNIIDKNDTNILLIADEAHNFGAEHMRNYLNENINYRIGLSATIERFMDCIGTKKLFDYFGERCISYSLEKAIKEGKSLVNYEYHPIPVYLSEEELNKYKELTRKLRKYMYKENGKIKYRKEGEILLFKRSNLLASTEEKIDKLVELLKKYVNDKHILIYCGATKNYDYENNEYIKQINLVTNTIEMELDMSVHKFTAREKNEDRKMILSCFSDGLYQVLTAIRCLDEGVNVPNIEIAFILASSRNPKQFIQRRGRLLRKAYGKEKAVIFDFITLPRHLGNVVDGDYLSDRSILDGEAYRMLEFAKTSLNEPETLNMLNKIEEAYGIVFDYGKIYEKLEDDYEYE